MRARSPKRPATTVVESAFIYPVVVLLLLGLIIGAMGMFRYQQVASLAREAARWASVRGGKYAKENGIPAATQADIYNNVVAPGSVSMDLSQLSCTVTWPNGNYPYHTNIDPNNNPVQVQNTVQVTLTYQWIPEAFLGGITLSSTSIMPMSY
jgi:hypothetical protein